MTTAGLLVRVYAARWQLNCIGECPAGWFAQLVRGGERLVERGPTPEAAVEAALWACVAPEREARREEAAPAAAPDFASLL